MTEDRSMIERRLAEAQDVVKLGTRRVERQHELIAELEQDGHDTTRPKGLLATFEATLSSYIQHRDLLLKELRETLNS